MFIKQAQQHRQFNFGDQIGDLEAGQLQHPDIGPGSEQTDQRHADIAGQLRVDATTTQQMCGQCGRGALAFGAGDSHHALATTLTEPDVRARGDMHTGIKCRLQRRMIQTDAGRFDQYLVALQRFCADGRNMQLPGHIALDCCQRRRCCRCLLAQHINHKSWQMLLQRRQHGLAFQPQPEHSDSRLLQIRQFHCGKAR